MPLKGKTPKGKGKRSLGADPGQKTLVAMFAAGVAAKRPKPVRTLEEENAIVENFAQDLDNVFGHYEDSIAHLEQLQRLADEKERKDRRLSRDALREGRSGRGASDNRRDSLGLMSLDSDFDLTPEQARAMETSADEFGDKFVCMLRALIQRGSGCPSRTCQKQLAVIISNHNAHKTPLLSAQAADTLAQLNRMYPSVSVEDGQDGKPTLAKSTGTWEPRLIGEVARWRAGQWRPDTAADRRGVMKPLGHWDIFVQFTSWACESLGRGGGHSEGSRGLRQLQQQQDGGGLLMLEQAVEAMLSDFSCRMQVFAAHCEPGGGGKSRRPTDLLRGSFLGELLEAGEDVHRSMTAADLINNLVYIIGSEAGDADAVDADDEEPAPALVSPTRSSRQRQKQQQQRRPAVVARHRLREAARGLLQGILEYYGSLEDTGCFNKFHGRAFRSNLRVAMDLRMLAAFQNELQSTEEKAAFLSSLAPRDRVRFIGSVVARLRAKRNKDKERYPQVVRVEQIYDSQSQEVNEYIDVDCLEVLRYIADDHKYAEKIKGIEGRDSLAMMVSQLIQGAADMAAQGPRSGDALLKLEEASERAVSVLMDSEPRTLEVAARVHLASVSLRLAKQG